MTPGAPTLAPFSASLRPDELLRVQYHDAPYRGFFCVRVVYTDGRIVGRRGVRARKRG